MSLLTYFSWHFTLDLLLLTCHSWVVTFCLSFLTYHSCHVTLNVFLLTHCMLLHVILYMSMLAHHSYHEHLGPLITEEDCTNEHKEWGRTILTDKRTNEHKEWGRTVWTDCTNEHNFLSLNFFITLDLTCHFYVTLYRSLLTCHSWISLLTCHSWLVTLYLLQDHTRPYLAHIHHSQSFWWTYRLTDRCDS